MPDATLRSRVEELIRAWGYVVVDYAEQSRSTGSNAPGTHDVLGLDDEAGTVRVRAMLGSGSIDAADDEAFAAWEEAREDAGEEASYDTWADSDERPAAWDAGLEVLELRLCGDLARYLGEQGIGCRLDKDMPAVLVEGTNR